MELGVGGDEVLRLVSNVDPGFKPQVEEARTGSCFIALTYFREARVV